MVYLSPIVSDNKTTDKDRKKITDKKERRRDMSERLITLQEIRDVLPCKETFLLLDRVQMLDENHYIATK